MSRLDWRDFGADPSGAMDSRQAINDCFQAAIDTGFEAYGPKGVYRTTGELVWNGPQLVSIEAPVSLERPQYFEAGTYGNPNVGGGTQTLLSSGMLARSGLPRGFAYHSFTLWFNGLFLRNNAGQLEQSTNGTDWAPV